MIGNRDRIRIVKRESDDEGMGMGMIAGDNVYSNTELYRAPSGQYDPPLPSSVQKEPEHSPEELCKYDVEKNAYGGGDAGRIKIPKDSKYHETRYDPPLPSSVLEVKSQRGKHSTQKPTELMKWVLKYYSKEDDIILDPTMGSGSTGVACKEMNRNFIGIEMNPEIFEVARERLEN